MLTVDSLRTEQQQFFEDLRYNKNRFRDFLHTMVYHYRQPLDRQVQLFFHAPKTGSAYASAELWKRLGTEIIEGASGVPVISQDGTSVTYIYDISETKGAMHTSIQSLVWKYDAEKDADAVHALFPADENPTTDSTMEARLLAACRRQAQASDTSAPELVALGASYVILARLGLNAEEAMGLPLILAKYENVQAEDVLKNISQTATAVLDPIARTIRQREQEAQRHDDTRRTPEASRTPEGSSDDGRGEERDGRSPLGRDDEAGGRPLPRTGNEPVAGGLPNAGSASDPDVDGRAEDDAHEAPLGAEGVPPAREDAGSLGVGGGDRPAGSMGRGCLTKAFSCG